MTGEQEPDRARLNARFDGNSRGYLAGRDLIIKGLKLTPARVGLALVTALVLVAVAIVGNSVLKDQRATHDTEVQRDAAKAVDSKAAPFTARYLFDTKVPEFWSIVLDKQLSKEQIEALEKLDGKDGQVVWDYLRPLGGRLLPSGDQPALAFGGAT